MGGFYSVEDLFHVPNRHLAEHTTGMEYIFKNTGNSDYRKDERWQTQKMKFPTPGLARG